jgi:hypothetical protein
MIKIYYIYYNLFISNILPLKFFKISKNKLFKLNLRTSKINHHN